MKSIYLKFVPLALLLVGNLTVQAEDFSEFISGGIKLNFSTLPESEGKNPGVTITGLADSDIEEIPTLSIPDQIRHEGVTYEIREISEQAFYNNKNVRNVTIYGSDLLDIGFRAFRYSKIESVKVYGTGDILFNNGCFSCCASLKEVYIGSNVRQFGCGTFQDCWNLQNITISPDNPYYSTDGIAVFDKDKTKLYTIIDSYEGDYRIPSTVTLLPHRDGWRYGQKLHSLTIPESVEGIANYVFLSGNIVIENPDVNSITLGDAAFRSPFSIKVPAGTVEKYKSAWSEYESVITDGSYEMSITTDEPLSTKKTVMIPVSLSNAENIIGFQCDIHLPLNAAIAMDSNNKYAVTLSDRATKSHTITAGVVSDGNTISGTSYQVIRLVCVSLTNASLKGNDGVLFYIPVTLSKIYESEYENTRCHAPVIIDNIHLSKPGNARVDLPNAGKYLRAIDYSPGDADNDGTVSVVDITSTISHMIGKTPENFTLTAVDFDNDGQIMINDVTALIDMVLNNDDDFGFKARSMGATESDYTMTVADVTAKEGSQAELTVSMNNEENIIGFQCDITLPEGVTINTSDDEDGYDCSLNLTRCTDHMVATKKVATKENTIRILVFSLSNTPLSGNSGTVFTCPVTVGASKGEHDVTLSRIILSTEENNRIDVPDYSGVLTVTGESSGLETINREINDGNCRYYDLQGRPATATTRDIIVSGKGKFLVR